MNSTITDEEFRLSNKGRASRLEMCELCDNPTATLDRCMYHYLRLYSDVGVSDQCWEWRGPRDVSGAAMAWRQEGTVRGAHLIAWEIENGASIPMRASGWPSQTRRTCKNRICVNPSHVLIISEGGNAAWCSGCDCEIPAPKGKLRRCSRCRKDATLLLDYNIDISGYESMLEHQDDGCAICGRAPSEKRPYLSVDHDHDCCPDFGSCGMCVRALLCIGCNNKLGTLENLEWVMQAFGYLKQYGKDLTGEYARIGDVLNAKA